MEAERLTRPSVEALDAILGDPIQCLDHGFIRLVDYMGDEAAITQAARVSYGKGTKTRNEDRGLLRYLMRHRHSTPFEMCEIKLHVKLPIFVARQWIRHRTANVNEYSARYSILNREFYIPEPEDVQPQSAENHQGRGGDLPLDVKRAMIESIRHHSLGSYEVYEELYTGWPHFDPSGTRWDDYNDPAERQHAMSIVQAEDYAERSQGMARELARMVVPPNVYTEWYWKVDLHNLLHFLSLRADPHAQKEIRVYADAICNLVETWVPNVWEAFVDYRLEAHTFSRQEMAVLREMVSHAPITQSLTKLTESGISRREADAFMSAILHGDKA